MGKFEREFKFVGGRLRLATKAYIMGERDFLRRKEKGKNESSNR